MKLILFLALASVLITGLESILNKHHKKLKDNEGKCKDSIQATNHECSCLHGGTCLHYGIYRKSYRCICPVGYGGKDCEKDLFARCYNGSGYEYRGTASKNRFNDECLHWDSPLLRNHHVNAYMKDALKLGIGKHNYCRNPKNGLKPWCYFNGPTGVTRMFCKIPKCEENKNTEPTCGLRQHKLYKIVGGMNSPVESQPWLATLYYIVRRNRNEQRYVCGASLIHPCWVLTAAHCFPDSEFPEPKDYTINLGKSHLYEENEYREQRFLVEKIIRHSDYSDKTGALNNDIALLKIRSESGQCASTTDYVQTVCLPSADLKLKDGTHCEIAGFGKETFESSRFSENLKSTSVQLISQDICQLPDYYGKLINNNMFCAGDPEWKVDACKGDSGGPLICQHNGKMVLYGIISWGDNCAKRNKPGVYTRITNYIQWIQDTMAEANNADSSVIRCLSMRSSSVQEFSAGG
ncbi:urokinase-type plasminogen activator isoform X1 [Phyllobates terribilis]|uniref:urokinase-type plasminogen activator isoform X1 n=1 Tax=Phyllobates terribilis TaxID=111132 RepID=UPI003CCAD3BB